MVRIHQELGLAAPPPDSPVQAWVVVVHTPGAALGILVDELVAVQRLEPSRLQPAATPLPTGAQPGHPIQLLSVPALLSAWPMGAIGAKSHEALQPPGSSHALSGDLAERRPGRQAVKTPPEAHLIIQAGRTLATRLAGIQEIALRARTQGDTGTPSPTHYPWHGTRVRLLDLRLATQGQPCSDGPEGRVLIVNRSSS